MTSFGHIDVPIWNTCANNHVYFNMLRLTLPQLFFFPGLEQNCPQTGKICRQKGKRYGLEDRTDSYYYCHSGKSMLMLLSYVPRLFWSQSGAYGTGVFSVWKTVVAWSSGFVVVLLQHLLSDYTATFNHLLTLSMVSFKHDNQNLFQMLTMDKADGKTDVQYVLWKAQMSCILNWFSCLGYFRLSPLAASFHCASMLFWRAL